jgi:hypothetical protein
MATRLELLVRRVSVRSLTPESAQQESQKVSEPATQPLQDPEICLAYSLDSDWPNVSCLYKHVLSVLNIFWKTKSPGLAPLSTDSHFTNDR